MVPGTRHRRSRQPRPPRLRMDIVMSQLLGIVLTSFAVRVEELIREGDSLALQVRAPLPVPRRCALKSPEKRSHKRS